MPIRINLLAEQQHQEELRRRDPVKRAIFLAVFFALLMCCWWGWVVWRKGMASVTRVSQEAAFKRLEKDAKITAENLKKIAEIERSLDALNGLATNRVLWAQALEALQQASMDSIQLVRLRVDQQYVQQAAVISKERGKSKPATATERIVLTLVARDYGHPDELNFNKFKEKLLKHPWFEARLAKETPILFKGITSRTQDKEDPARYFVSFTMECSFTEKVRD